MFTTTSAAATLRTLTATVRPYRPGRAAVLAAAAAIALLGAGLYEPLPADAQAASGSFAATPVFNEQGLAFAVYNRGSVDQLERAATDVRASGVWA